MDWFDFWAPSILILIIALAIGSVAALLTEKGSNMDIETDDKGEERG